MSAYGSQFDRLAERWAVLENEHDKQHPDRDQCGGVGGCSMMFAAVHIENEMTEALVVWRQRQS
jgi:hypothetical protein